MQHFGIQLEAFCVNLSWYAVNIDIMLVGVANRIVGIPIKINGAVSPNARDSDKMNQSKYQVKQPVIRRRIVCHLFAPKP